VAVSPTGSTFMMRNENVGLQLYSTASGQPVGVIAEAYYTWLLGQDSGYRGTNLTALNWNTSALTSTTTQIPNIAGFDSLWPVSVSAPYLYVLGYDFLWNTGQPYSMLSQLDTRTTPPTVVTIATSGGPIAASNRYVAVGQTTAPYPNTTYAVLLYPL